MMATASKKKLLEIDFNFVEFDSLCKEVQNCKLCPRMKGSQRVLNYSAGNLEAKIMFIGEAPGRLGADESGIPFHGDKAGNNFEILIVKKYLLLTLPCVIQRMNQEIIPLRMRRK
jgi:uracil-DNA glycosylase